MNWKLFLTCTLVILAAFTGTMFFLSGQPFTVQGFVMYVVTGTVSTLTLITGFIMDKWLWLLGTITPIMSGILGIRKYVSNVKKSAQATAQSQISQTQLQVAHEFQTMKETITAQAQTIEEQKQKITETTTLKTQIEQSEEAYKQLWNQHQTTIAELRGIQSTGTQERIQQLEETLRQNGLPVPAPTDLKTVMVVK